MTDNTQTSDNARPPGHAPGVAGVVASGGRDERRRFTSSQKAALVVVADVPTLRRLCADDVVALDALDRATANGVGRPANGNDSLPLKPSVESTPGTLRRLRHDAPELHGRVLAGELSPHAAAVEAGFRPRRVSVRTDDPASAARTLASAYGDRLADLVAALEGML